MEQIILKCSKYTGCFKIVKRGHVQNSSDQNPPSQIREPLTDRG